MHRRQFIKACAGPAATASIAGSMPAVASKGYFSRPGLQLFTVMTQLDKDFDGTLKTVSDIGYRQVETMGSFNMSAKELQTKLLENNLVTLSQHLMPGDLYQSFSRYNRGELTWDEIIKIFIHAFDFSKVETFIEEAINRAIPLGQKYIVWQVNWQKEYGMKEVKQHLKAFRTAGKMCKEAGLTFAFHNHDHEFQPLKGTTAYDILVQETDPDEVKMEMDFMWASYAGVDPAAYLRKYPGRYKLAHLKDHDKSGKIVLPGQGVEDFTELLKAAEEAGIEQSYFEFDQPVNPIEEITAAYKYLSAIPRK